MGKAVLEQPATLGRPSNEACQSFYIGIGQEQLALPSWQRLIPVQCGPVWAWG